MSPGRHDNIARLTAALALTCACASICASQVYPFHTWSVRDGLPSNDVAAIYQDSRGFMWFGTTDGLSMFDGRSFTNHGSEDGLPDNNIVDLFEDRKQPGTMWMVSGAHLTRFSSDSFRVFTLPVSVVRSIHQDSAGVIWCASSPFVVRVDGDSISTFGAGWLAGGAVGIAEVGDSVLWFSRKGELISYHRRSGALRRIPLSRYDLGEPSTLLADAHGNVWLGIDNNYLLKVDNAGTVETRRFPISTAWLATDRNGGLWMGGYEGIASLRSGSLTGAQPVYYTVSNGLPENSVRSIFVDREENLWVGGRDLGVSRLSSMHAVKFPLGPFQRYALSHNQPPVASDRAGKIWVAMDDSVVVFSPDRAGRWERKRASVPGAGDTLNSLYVDDEGRLWVETAYWGSRLKSYSIDGERNGSDHAVLRPHGTIDLRRRFPGGWAMQYLVTRSGEVWLAMGQEGIIRIDPGRENPVLKVFGEADGVQKNYVRSLFEDHRGRIWGGTFTAGVLRIDPVSGTVRRFAGREGVRSAGVWSFTETPDGRVIAGTGSGGIALFEGDSVRTQTVTEGLPSNTVYALTRDSTGRVWMGTSVGMAFEDPPGSLKFRMPRDFSGASVRFSGTTASGHVWWVTAGALYIFNPEPGRVDTIPPAIHIKSLIVDGLARNFGAGLTLDPDENNCEISFVGINFRDEEALRYTYRLVGAESDWQGPTRNVSVTYGHLESGQYRFEVSAIGSGASRSIIPATVAITILPPYWRRWWFLGLAGMLLAVAGGTAYRSKILRLRREQEIHREFAQRLIQSQEEERKRIARELHDDLGQELIVITNRAKRGSKSAVDELSKGQFDLISRTASGALNSVRDFAFALSPYHLEQVGLQGAVRGMVEKISELSEIRFNLIFGEIGTVVTKEAEIHIYRIVQECVNNIVKHSGATEASVTIRSGVDVLDILIADNGRGFKPGSGDEGGRKGFGLRGLEERVRLLSGALSIGKPATGIGTEIHIRIQNTIGTLINKPSISSPSSQ